MPASGTARSFAELIQQALRESPHSPSAIRSKAGVSKSNWDRILRGSRPNVQLAVQICLALGLDLNVLGELYSGQDDLADSLEGIERLLVQTGVRNTTQARELISTLGLEGDREKASTFRDVLAAALEPYSTALGSEWEEDDIKDIRHAWKDHVETWLDLGKRHPKHDPSEFQSEFVPGIIGLTQIGLRKLVEEEITFDGRKRQWPSIPCSIATYSKAHQLALDAARNRPGIVLGITTLLPSMWYASLPAKNLGSTIIGVEHPGTRDYRRRVEEYVRRQGGEVRRLTLTTTDEALMSLGVFHDRHVDEQQKLCYASPGSASDGAFEKEAYRIASSLIAPLCSDESSLRPPNGKDRKHLIFPADLAQLPKQVGNLELEGLVKKYVRELHHSPEHAKRCLITTGSGTRDEISVSRYLERLGHPIFDIWLFGIETGSKIKWEFGICGEAFWPSQIALLRLIADPSLLEYLGDFWNGAFLSSDAKQWANEDEIGD
ncbi:MAG: hypothetical protein JSS66_08615 [Armatimonadetes bacterium]|nr:hypothetical protein [Armatimonadota bacterium]